MVSCCPITTDQQTIEFYIRYQGITIKRFRSKNNEIKSPPTLVLRFALEEGKTLESDWNIVSDTWVERILVAILKMSLKKNFMVHDTGRLVHVENVKQAHADVSTRIRKLRQEENCGHQYFQWGCVRLVLFDKHGHTIGYEWDHTLLPTILEENVEK